jgi:uncharacterized membrane protein
MRRWLSVAQWLVVAATFAASAVGWVLAPQRVAIHWSLRGQPDGYADKLPGLFLLPVASLALFVLLRLAPRIDPLRQRYAEFADAYAVVLLAVVAFLAAVQAMILATALGAEVNSGLVIGPLVGVLLIVVGAVLDRLKPNWFMGIRTPWTLSSERSWTATHHAGRYVFFAMGIAVALAGVLQVAWAFSLAMIVCLGGLLGLVVYSYVVWRQDPRADRPLSSQPR